MSVNIKKLSLSEIDDYLVLLDNSVNGRDSRVHKRIDTKIPLTFLIKGATGELKVDMSQSAGDSYFCDLSKGGAGVMSNRSMAKGQEFFARGNGDKKVFNALLKVINVRKDKGHTHYGCSIISLKMLPN